MSDATRQFRWISCRPDASSDYQSAPTTAQLTSTATSYMNANATTSPAVSIDVSFTADQLSEILICPHKVLCRSRIDHKGMLIISPGVRVKSKGLDRLFLYVVQCPFCLKIAKLDHPGPDPEIRKDQLKCHIFSGVHTSVGTKL